MDIEGARKFRVSNRSLTLIIPLVTLLVASVFWNIRQHRLIEQQRLRAIGLQREEAARPGRKPSGQEARMKKNAEWAASDARDAAIVSGDQQS